MYFENARIGNATTPAYVIDNNTGQVQQYQGGYAAMNGAKQMEAAYANPYNGVQAALGGFGNFGGGGDPFYQQSMQQSQQIQNLRNQGMYGGTANQQGFPSSSFNTGNSLFSGNSVVGGGAAYGANDINSLLQRQLAENDRARAANEANWQTAKGYIQGLDSNYFSDPITQGSRQQAANLLNDPLSLSADVVSKMQSRAAGQIDNSVNQQMRDAQYLQAMNGQTDASSLQAAAERADRMALAQRVGAQSTIDIQKAMQDKNDVARAIGVGQQQSQMDQGVRQNQAALFADAMPQHKPDDYSGLIAGLGLFNYGANAGRQQQSSIPNTGTGGQAGGMFSGWQNINGAPLNLSVNNMSGTPQSGAGFNSMFDHRASQNFDNSVYNQNKIRQNQQNTQSWNQFAGTQQGGMLPTKTAPQWGGNKYGGAGAFA